MRTAKRTIPWSDSTSTDRIHRGVMITTNTHQHATICDDREREKVRSSSNGIFPAISSKPQRIDGGVDTVNGGKSTEEFQDDLQCKECGRRFTQKCDVYKHLRSAHNLPGPGPFPKFD